MSAVFYAGFISKAFICFQGSPPTAPFVQLDEQVDASKRSVLHAISRLVLFFSSPLTRSLRNDRSCITNTGNGEADDKHAVAAARSWTLLEVSGRLRSSLELPSMQSGIAVKRALRQGKSLIWNAYVVQDDIHMDRETIVPP
jgi:hypothetical protein